MSLIVAGEAPKGRRGERNGPWTNKAGNHFRETFISAVGSGASPHYCYPQSKDELLATVEENNGRYVVLSGNYVLHFVQPELYIRQCHGRAMLLEPDSTVLAFPVFHHEAYARKPKDYQWYLEQELRLLYLIARDRENWMKYTPPSCVKCRGAVAHVDRCRVRYCDEHWGVSSRGLAALRF